jgi:hypothetical protein
MIVDVDCTADGKSTCAQQDVKGYPTIKYFMAGSKKGCLSAVIFVKKCNLKGICSNYRLMPFSFQGQDYQGGRDYAALSKFVESTLDIAKCEPLTGSLVMMMI